MSLIFFILICIGFGFGINFIIHGDVNKNKSLTDEGKEKLNEDGTKQTNKFTYKDEYMGKNTNSNFLHVIFKIIKIIGIVLAIFIGGILLLYGACIALYTGLSNKKIKRLGVEKYCCRLFI